MFPINHGGHSIPRKMTSKVGCARCKNSQPTRPADET